MKPGAKNTDREAVSVPTARAAADSTVHVGISGEQTRAWRLAMSHADPQRVISM